MDRLKMFAVANVVLGFLTLTVVLTPFIVLFTQNASDLSLFMIVLTPLTIIFGLYFSISMVILILPALGFFFFIVFIFVGFATYYLSDYINDSSLYKVTSIMMTISALFLLFLSIVALERGISMNSFGFAESLVVFLIAINMFVIPLFVLIGLLFRHMGDAFGLSMLKTLGTLTIVGSVILGFLIPLSLIASYFELAKVAD